MNRPMRIALAACAVSWLCATGCGGGTTPNARVAPTITSTPPTSATVDVPFEYRVTAVGMTPLAFAVVSAPEGFRIHAANGMVSWTPRATGTVLIEVRVSNLAGSATQAFDVEVVGLSGPVFLTEPPTEATVAAEYTYDPAVAANGSVSWSAPIAPEGLTIDVETGAVRWTPSVAQVGPQRVAIRATEEDGGLFADQEFMVTVEDTGGPAVITSMPPTRLYAGEVLVYEATASGAPTIRWTVEEPSMGNPAPAVTIVTSPPTGSAVRVEWDTATVGPGDYTIALRVDNGLGDPGVQEFTVIVDPRPPIPEIDLVTSPPPDTIFVGSAYRYDVELTPQSESAGVVWTLVGATVPADLAITIDRQTGEVGFTASQTNGEIEYRYTIRAENVLGIGDEATISVQAVYPPASPILTVTPETSFRLEVGERFPGASATATGQPAPVLTTSGTLPDFLSFDPLTGLLSASSSQPVPEEADIGVHSFELVATNSEGMDRVAIDITVVAPPARVDSITPAAGRRQSEVPIVLRGDGFVSAGMPVIRLQRGAYTETLATTFIDETTLIATVPIDLGRPSGVHDVVVDQGSTTILAKRFTVTEGDGLILSGSIATDTTLTALDSPHVVTGNVSIENGATVTVEPGAVVMFAGNTNLLIEVGVASAGALIANGGEPGAGDQIVFTRFQDVGGPVPSGHYRGLRFGANLISATTVLRNVVVEFGGRRNAEMDRGAVEVLSGSAPRITDSIIRESLNYGLFAQAGAGSDTFDWFDGNQLTGNGRSPISVGSDEVSTLGANLNLLGNGLDRVLVRGTVVSRAGAAWVNYGVPFYLLNGLTVRGGSTLTIAPGTEMRFAPGRRLQVATGTEQGTLIASGTAAEPIRMVPDGSTWDGVFLERLTQSGTALRDIRIEGVSAAVTGGLRVADPATPGERVAIVERCLIQSSESGSTGVHLANDARLRSFESSVLDVVGLSVSAALVGFDDLLQPSNTYEAPLRVRAGTSQGAQMVWYKPLAADASVQPIRPTGSLTVSDGSLRIEAGSRVEMPLDGRLTITSSQLEVLGTPGEPVVFEPAAGAGYWSGIRLRGSGGNGTSRISHAVLEAAGSNPALGAATGRAAIVVEPFGGLAATPAISNTTVLLSNGYGMTFADSTHCADLCNDNMILGSRFSAVRIYANFVGRFGSGNSMTGNDTSGMREHEGVWVVGDAIDRTATWPANDVPYVVQGDLELRRSSPLAPVPILTIMPGAELRFAEDRRLRVGEGNDGTLDARGTPSAPIMFTSMDVSAPLFWRGIDFNQGSSGSILDHVMIWYGGRTDDTGSVNLRTGSAVTIGEAVFARSRNYAAVVYPGSAPAFTGPPSSRTYVSNGQQSNPGPGDPAFDCVWDIGADLCTQP